MYPKGDTQRQELAPTASRVPLTDKYDCNPMDFILRSMELTLHGMKLWVCKVFGFLPPSGAVGRTEMIKGTEDTKDAEDTEDIVEMVDK